MKGYVIDLYSRFPSFAYVDYFVYSDEGTWSSGNSNAVTMGTMSKSNVPDDLQYWDYGFIRDINVFLENAPDAPVQDNVKNQLLGEVTAMRATAYFEMAKRYGGVPLITEVIDPYGSIPEELQMRKKEEDIYDFVEAEYVKAIQILE